MKLSGLPGKRNGASPFGRVHSDALHEQNEMGWNRTRDDVGARAANGGDKVLWECIGPYEAEVRYALRISRRNPTKWLRRDKEERGSECGVFAFTRKRNAARPF